MHLFSFVLLSLFPFFGICSQCNQSEICLPSCLLYDGKPIPDKILEDFFGCAVVGFGEPSLELDIFKCLAQQEEEKIISDTSEENEENIDSEESYNLGKTVFEWEYVGTINDFSVVRAYTWEVGSLGKFTGFLILKREGNTLRIVDIIYGGDRHSSMIFKESATIVDHMIIYHQAITTGNLIDEAMMLYPELEDVYATNSREKICYGEAGYCGSFEKTAYMTSEGKVKTINIIGFSPCIGYEYQIELYEKMGLKGLALDFLKDRDVEEKSMGLN